MRGHFFSKTVALVCLMFPGLCLAPSTSGQEIVNAKLAHFRARMQGFVDRHEIAGAVTVVGRRDGILSHEAIGSLDLARKQPMRGDALFRIASMTKPITALGIMILVDDGKLKTTDPVEQHLPEFRGQMLVAGRTEETVVLRKPARPITVRDLLTHTSGLPDRTPLQADIYLRRNHTLAETVMAYSQRPLESEPGRSWAYCNMGVDTLGRIIEVASGRPYEEFLRERVFVPLGMKDTTFYPTREQAERAAVPGMKRGGELVPLARSLFDPPAGARFPMPCGGLYTTGPDLAQLYRMMLGGGALGTVRVVSEESVAAMTKVQTGDIRSGPVGTGFGWAVVRTPRGENELLSPGSYGHGGALHTNAWIDPKKGLFTILLIQRQGLSGPDAAAMRGELQSLAAGWDS
jgi:CubicO group peptidase (beta-lactamase class C family)